MERDEMVAHVAAAVRRALHAEYHMNADPYEDDPLRFGVAFPDGFVEVVVALAAVPAPTEPLLCAHRLPVHSWEPGEACPPRRVEPAPQADTEPDSVGEWPWLRHGESGTIVPAPQAEPDRCPTCRSYDRGVFFSRCVGVLNAWHTEGADR